MKFSQGIGKTPIKTVLQIESIDEDLRNRLWSIVLEELFDKLQNSAPSYVETQKGQVCKVIWKEFFNEAVDKIPSFKNSNNVCVEEFIEYLRDWFFEAKWYEIYDLIEFLTIFEINAIRSNYTKACNLALEKEVAGYRIINDKIAQITSEVEIIAIGDAILNTDKWQSVSTHLATSLNDLADRKNPNYRNSIKESISAVESFCKIITKDDKATLSKALAEIERNHNLHRALKTAFSAIYGYTSDSSGIRHALLETDVPVEFEDAKFMLVSCSAFINYLKTKIKI